MKLLILIISFLTTLFQLGAEPKTVIEEEAYAYVALNDSATIEMYSYTPDSVLVIMTACAPQCASCARVYHKEGEVTQTLTPPFVSIFPLATVNRETGEITWTDNDNWEY